MNAPSWLSSVLLSPDTCSTSWQPFLVSLSPAAAALLSATALYVAARARSISRGAQETSLEARLHSQLAIGSQLGTEPLGRHEAPEKP